MRELIKQFLAMVQAIADTKPAYKGAEDGDNGLCDCIGLIIHQGSVHWGCGDESIFSGGIKMASAGTV